MPLMGVYEIVVYVLRCYGFLWKPDLLLSEIRMVEELIEKLICYRLSFYRTPLRTCSIPRSVTKTVIDGNQLNFSRSIDFPEFSFCLACENSQRNSITAFDTD